MGLLSKAGTNSSPPLDDMGEALCTRLLSLTSDDNRAETAITLLKAYGSFQSGICLSLHDGVYSSYASVAAGNPEITFNAPLLQELPGKKYYSVDYKPPNQSASLRYWAFPISNSSEAVPPEILMVGEDKDSFQGQIIEEVLKKAGGVFLPGNDSVVSEPEEQTASRGGGLLSLIEKKLSSENTAPEADVEFAQDATAFDDVQIDDGIFGETAFDESAFTGSSLADSGFPESAVSEVPEEAVPQNASEKAVMEILDSSFEKLGNFQGCVIEALKYSAGEFLGRLSSMVSTFGTAQGLAPGRCLVLFDTKQDGELIASHLSKTVQGKTAFSFHSENPQGAFTLLKPYL